MNTNLRVMSIRLLMTCLMTMAIASSTEAKCPYSPVTFYASYVDSGFLFYNTGKVDLPVKFDFGDGQSFYGVKPQNGIFHKYAKNGSYTVTMYYYDSIQYCRDTAVQQVCFFKLKDSIVFRKSNDTLYTAAPCHVNAFYRWSYGDNTYGKNCQSWHVYQKSGFYYPQLLLVIDTLSSCYYNYNYKASFMDFSKCGFIADFYNEKYMGMQPLRLKAIVGTGPFLDPKKKQSGRETWYWGDNSSSNDNGIMQDKDTHFYARGGTYNVCHVYEDSAQCKDSVCKAVEVDSCNAYTQFTYTVNGRELSFNFKVAGNYSWYADGKKITLSNGKYTFASNGTYTICLKSTGMDNCVAEACSTVTVFSCDRLSANNIRWTYQNNDCTNLKFRNTNTNYQIFNWDFGDNSTGSTDREPVHTYARDSVYTVKLSAIDTVYNCKDSIVFYVIINCCNIQDSLKLSKTSAGTAVLENYSYIRKPRGPVHSHKWIFDWSTVSTDAFPTHTYYSKGYKHIIYIAYDTIRDCNDSFYISLRIDSTDNTPFQLYVSNTSSLHNLNMLQSLDVYPNPVQGTLFISGLDNAEISGISFYNLMGQETKMVWKMENGICLLYLPDSMNPGIYILRIQTGQGIYGGKIVKE